MSPLNKKQIDEQARDLIGTTTSIALHRSMPHLVLDIRKHFQHVIEADERLTSARIRLGLNLLEARRRVEAGEAGDGIRWWDWFDKTFPQSRSNAEHVMALAAKPNPVAAHEAEKAATRERVRALRSRASAVHPSCTAEPVVTESTTYETEPPDRQAPMTTEQDQEVLPPEPSEQDLIDQIIDLYQRLSRHAQVRCAVRLRKVIRGDA
jgi:hypothetical protein